MKYKYHKNKQGFTLIETLIAIAILTVAIGSAFTIAQKSLQTSAFSKNQNTAYFLASEGVELVRAIRDNTAIYNRANISSKVDWLNTFKSKCNISNPSTLLTDSCVFDIDPISTNMTIKRVEEDLTYCSTGKGCRLKIEKLYESTPSKMFTSVGTGSTYSMFYRKITISEKIASTGTNTEGTTVTEWKKMDAVVTSTVYWANESFTVKETLTNWQ